MATDDRSDFDLASLLQAPATAVAGFMGLADGAKKAVTGILDTIASLQRAAAALEQLSTRMTSLLDDIEAPVRALTPEFERAVTRFQRVADAFDGPIDRLLPGLENAVDTFDRMALSQLPENMDQLREQVVTIVEVFSEFPRRMVGLAQLVPGLERLASFRPVPRSTPSTPVAAASSNTPVSTSPRAKATPAKASPAKKASPTKSPAKKASPTKAPAKKVSAKKVSATKVPATSTAAKGPSKASAAKAVGTKRAPNSTAAKNSRR